MIAATVLSAIATAGTGTIALMQYRTMERAINSPNKNESFQELLRGLSEACVAAQPFRSWLISLNIDKDSYPSDKDFDGLDTPVRRLHTAFDAFKVWLEADKRVEILAIEYAFTSSFDTLLLRSVFGSKKQFTADHAFRILQVCTTGSNQIISWFHDGRQIDFSPYLISKVTPSSLGEGP
ncbi:hypothetical protein [Rhizobium sp. AN5]|uniref:hypothetical protein n=1 Tax=Rhizobium sp. AN5 TaxID=1855304 RepID=UPI001179CCFD|nr:hypothetical protein [Rhizobium sp. AN5]